MITYSDPLRDCCSTRISFSHTHYTFLKKRDEGVNTAISGKRAALFLLDPRFLTTRTLTQVIAHDGASILLNHSRVEGNIAGETGAGGGVQPPPSRQTPRSSG